MTYNSLESTQNNLLPEKMNRKCIYVDVLAKGYFFTHIVKGKNYSQKREIYSKHVRIETF